MYNTRTYKLESMPSYTQTSHSKYISGRCILHTTNELQVSMGGGNRRLKGRATLNSYLKQNGSIEYTLIAAPCTYLSIDIKSRNLKQ